MGYSDYYGEIYETVLAGCRPFCFPAPWDFVRPRRCCTGTVADPAGTLAALLQKYSADLLSSAGVVEAAPAGEPRLGAGLTDPAGAVVALRAGGAPAVRAPLLTREFCRRQCALSGRRSGTAGRPPSRRRRACCSPRRRSRKSRSCVRSACRRPRPPTSTAPASTSCAASTRNSPAPARPGRRRAGRSLPAAPARTSGAGRTSPRPPAARRPRRPPTGPGWRAARRADPSSRWSAGRCCRPPPGRPPGSAPPACTLPGRGATWGWRWTAWRHGFSPKRVSKRCDIAWTSGTSASSGRPCARASTT